LGPKALRKIKNQYGFGSTGFEKKKKKKKEQKKKKKSDWCLLSLGAAFLSVPPF
jgi:hypothetical protein